MHIYSASGCPYAQRTRALLTLLGQPFELTEIDLTNKPAEFVAKSPTGAVPLLDDSGFVLFESAVINEYLSEKFEWKEAYGGGVQPRARERLAMRRFDEVLVPLFFRTMKDPSAPATHATWQRELSFFADIVKQSKARSLLGLHCATHWVRMGWVQPASPVYIAMREAAGAFLDEAAALPEVQATLPEREVTVQMIRAKFG